MNNIILLIALTQVSVQGADQQDFDQARQQSLTTGRPLVVLIGAVWCPACQKMKNSILPQVAENGGLDKVVFTYVDFDQQRQLASRLSRGMSIPQLIRFNKTPAGENNNRLIGARSPREVYDFINAGLIGEKEVSKVSTTDRFSDNSRKAAPDEPLRSTSPAVKTGIPSSADAARDKQWKASSTRVEKAGSSSTRVGFFKKLFQERKNWYEGSIHDQDQASPTREYWVAGQSPGQRKTDKAGFESETVVAGVAEPDF